MTETAAKGCWFWITFSVSREGYFFGFGGMRGAITDIPGIRVGHWTDREAATGCTVVLCESGAVGGIDIRGSAPGTRETALLCPMNLVERVHAVLLSGGSAFGLEAASGVMRYLEEGGWGYDAGVAKVPIVPAAILFDLSVGDVDARPGADEGYKACLAAGADEIAGGSIGAGTGATVGKILGIDRATKGGLGTASKFMGKNIVVAALVAVNSFGDVVSPETGKVLAGPRRRDGGGFFNTVDLLEEGAGGSEGNSITNTVIGVVATNAALDKTQANGLARMADGGLVRTIWPAHTMFDGDVIFTLSLSNGEEVNLTTLGAVASEVVSAAILQAVNGAESLAGIPAVRDLDFGVRDA
jgi:L-aminopeptidase/D-esterase-like protein